MWATKVPPEPEPTPPATIVGRMDVPAHASPPISLCLIALRSRESERGAQVAHEVDAVLGFLTLSDRVGEQLTGQLTAGGS